MSTERDTHFAGFAKLLWDELVNANEYSYIDVNTDDDGIDPTNYRLLIARRAYDLVQHALRTCPLESFEVWAEEAVQDIPDLTKWPVEPNDVSGSNPA